MELGILCRIGRIKEFSLYIYKYIHVCSIVIGVVCVCVTEAKRSGVPPVILIINSLLSAPERQLAVQRSVQAAAPGLKTSHKSQPEELLMEDENLTGSCFSRGVRSDDVQPLVDWLTTFFPPPPLHPTTFSTLRPHKGQWNTHLTPVPSPHPKLNSIQQWAIWIYRLGFLRTCRAKRLSINPVSKHETQIELITMTESHFIS